jgi:hypothetical protein
MRPTICGRSFGDKRAQIEHMALTTKHENVVTYIRRLEFLLAEAEDNVKFWRDARRDYNGRDDFARSIEEAYRVIRERKANGGPGWGGWE